jgi:hypothetical protein
MTATMITITTAVQKIPIVRTLQVADLVVKEGASRHRLRSDCGRPVPNRSVRPAL